MERSGSVNPSEAPADAVRNVARMRGPGEARLLASGALLQQVAQASGLLALLVIVTLLARDLTVAELGAYGLVASLAGYLLVLRNSVASAAVRAMAGAAEGEERASVYAVARRLYALVGVATGLLIAGRRGSHRRHRPRRDARRTTRAPAASAWGWSRPSASPRASSSTGSARSGCSRPPPARRSRPSAIYLVLMVGLIVADVSLSVIIALSGLLPLLSGAISGVVVRRRGLRARRPRRRDRRHTAAIVPTAGWLLVIELSNLAMYASGRIILGAYKTPRAVGPVRGAGARTQPAVRAGRGARGARPCRPPRATSRPATTAACASWPCAAAATRSRCSCRCA